MPLEQLLSAKDTITKLASLSNIMESIEHLSQQSLVQTEEMFATVEDKIDSLTNSVLYELEKQTHLLYSIDKKLTGISKLSPGKENKDLIKMLRSGTDVDLKEESKKLLVMSAAILAFGTAFNKIGNIDMKTVIGVSGAILIIGTAYSQIIQLPGIGNPLKVGLATSSLFLLSMSLVAISHVMARVNTAVSQKQFITAAMIGASMLPIVYAFGEILKAMKVSGMDVLFSAAANLKFNFAGISGGGMGGNMFKEMASNVGRTLAVLPLLALTIVAASFIYQAIPDISPKQLINAIGVSASFIPIAIAFSTLLTVGKFLLGSSVEDMATNTLKLVAVAGAITAIANILAFIPDSINTNTITAMGFIALSMMPMAMIFSIIKRSKIKLKHVTRIGLNLLSMASITLGIGFILDLLGSLKIDYKSVISIGLIGAALIPIAFAFSIVLRMLGSIKTKMLVKSALIFPMLALSMVYTAHVFKLLPDKYKAPPVEWVLKTSFSTGLYGLYMLAMIPLIKVAGVNGLLKASVAGPVIAISLVAIAYILQYLPDKYKAPPVKWTLKTGLLLGVAGMAMLPVALVAKLIGIKGMFLAAITGPLLALSLTGVAWAFQLLPDEFKRPPITWTLAVSTALFLFAPIIALLGLIPLALIAKGAVALPLVGLGIVGLAHVLMLLPAGVAGLASIFGAFVDIFTIVVAAVIKLFGELVRIALPLIEEFLITLLRVVVEVLPQILPPIGAFIESLIASIGRIITDVTPLLEYALDKFVIVIRIATQFISQIVGSLSGIIETVVNGIIEGMTKMNSFFELIFSHSPERIKETAISLVAMAGALAAISAAMAGQALAGALTAVTGAVAEFIGIEGGDTDAITVIDKLLARGPQIAQIAEPLKSMATIFGAIGAIGNASFDGLETFFDIIEDYVEDENNVQNMRTFADGLSIVLDELERLAKLSKPIDIIAKSFKSMAESMKTFKGNIEGIDAEVVKDIKDIYTSAADIAAPELQGAPDEAANSVFDFSAVKDIFKEDKKQNESATGNISGLIQEMQMLRRMQEESSRRHEEILQTLVSLFQSGQAKVITEEY